MAFPDYDYDVYEDFEDALTSPWTVVNPDTNIDTQSTTQKHGGSQSCEIDSDGADTTKDVAYIYYDHGSEVATAVSFGFWWRVPPITDTYFTGFRHGTVGTDYDGYPRILRIQFIGDDGFKLYLAGDTTSDRIAVSVSTWYWITIKIVKNGTCTMRIYDEAHDQVGSDVTCTGYDLDWRYISFGNVTVAQYDDTNMDQYIDDFVIDTTDATFPLLGWETAAPAEGQPAIRRLGGVNHSVGHNLQGFRRW